jgi:hypothetical protein
MRKDLRYFEALEAWKNPLIICDFRRQCRIGLFPPIVLGNPRGPLIRECPGSGKKGNFLYFTPGTILDKLKKNASVHHVFAVSMMAGNIPPQMTTEEGETLI